MHHISSHFVAPDRHFYLLATILLLSHFVFSIFCLRLPHPIAAIVFCFSFLFLKKYRCIFSSKYLPFLSPKLLSFQNEVAVFLFSVPNFRFAKQALLPTETMPFALQDSLFCFSRAFTCGSRLCSVLSQSICLLPIKLCLLFYKALSVVFYKLHLLFAPPAVWNIYTDECACHVCHFLCYKYAAFPNNDTVLINWKLFSYFAYLLLARCERVLRIIYFSVPALGVRASPTCLMYACSAQGDFFVALAAYS